MYYVYGKHPEDKQFKPLNARGIRVSKADAEVFLTREEAQEFVDKNTPRLREGCKLDIRCDKKK